MAWGYAIWDGSNNKIIDTSDSSLFAFQCYPGTVVVTGTQSTTYDLLGIGTSSVNFHYAVRKFPSGTHRREMLFTHAGMGATSTYSSNIDPTLGSIYINQITSFTVRKPDPFTTKDVTSWKSDVEFHDQLVLYPITI